MEKTNEVQKVKAEPPEVKTESPLMMAASLVQQTDGKIDVDKLEALLKVQMQWEAGEAKKSYVVAMAAFKANSPEIIKDKSVNYKQVNYNHASLGNVTATINKALSEHGLTASWVTEQENGSVKVKCKITHVMGHSEECSLAAPPDATGSKNAIQAIGSTVTYLQRYTLLALTGLATYDQDDDGEGSGKPKMEIPEMTDANKETIQAIYAVLEKSLDSGLEIDHEKVCNIFFAQKGVWPADVERAGVAAAWLISLNMRGAWTRETK